LQNFYQFEHSFIQLYKVRLLDLIITDYIGVKQEGPYVPAPLKTISPALKGDLYTAHKMMLEDKEASKKAEIQVENINGAILILSGINDEMWPATEMSDKLIKRLKNKNFNYYNEHIKLDGGHIAPLEHFNLVYDFLDKHLPTK
jgi:hypothetical protein